MVALLSFVCSSLEHRYDFVEVRDGEKDYSVPYLTPGRGFSGNLSYSVMASANVMWIKFNSDATVSRQGFNLTYEAFGKSIFSYSIYGTVEPPLQRPVNSAPAGHCREVQLYF